MRIPCRVLVALILPMFIEHLLYATATGTPGRLMGDPENTGRLGD